MWGDPVELSHMLATARRQLNGLNCSHAKNWGAYPARVLSIMNNPSALVMKGFMVATMNPLSWDVVLRSTLSDQWRGPIPAEGALGSLTLHDVDHELRTQGFLFRHHCPDDRRSQVPSKRAAASLTLHDWNHEPHTQAFCPSSDS